MRSHIRGLIPAVISLQGRGRSLCRECPEGTFCNQTGLAEPVACPMGHYCPAGSTLPLPCPVVRAKCFPPTPCRCSAVEPPHPQRDSAPLRLSAQGTYGTGSCTPCTPGMYCSMAGLARPEGLCQPGYYCVQGSSSPSPVSCGLVCQLLSQVTAKDFVPDGHFVSLIPGGTSLW